MENSPQKFQLALLMLAMSAVSLPAAAQKSSAPLLDRGKFSIGAGVGFNEIDRPPLAIGDNDETGFQVFGAYRLTNVNVMQGVGSAIEFGYMDYGFPNADGVWATFNVDGPISNSFSWLARAGLDFGDDDGLMVGAGLGIPMNNRTSLRFEYVVRDTIDSLQLNLLIKL